MPEREQTTTSLRFGPFELLSESRELRKYGVRLKLSGQPIEVLLMLAEQPGRVISRQELQQKLWPGDSYGDFEHGLNAAVNRLRETLGDSAETPIFIETIPRRGYRFIASVERPVGQDNTVPAPVDTPERHRNKHILKRSSAVAALAMMLLIVLVAWNRQAQPPTVANVKQITNDGRAKSPMNLPVTDGVHIYFIEGMPWTTGSGIAQHSAAGGETTWIATTLKDPLAIYDISPDRSELLLVRGTAANSDLAGELWVQPLPAGAPHRVGNIIASDACWTPDGMHIVYGYHHALMITNKDGSEPRQLATISGSGAVRGLRFSPDGRRIRFHVFQESSAALWEMKADGRDLHPLFADWKESPYQCCGNWSPDGNYYYFQAGLGNAQGIWVISERRSIFGEGAAKPSRLISGPLRFSVPLPSSDGKKLFVVGEEPRVELYRYELRTQRFDPYLPGFSAGPVDFSFDRKWMAYVSYPEMTLWRSRVDGSVKMQLTFPPVRAYGPRWSPDGSKIAFTDVQLSRPSRAYMLSSLGGDKPEPLVPGETEEYDADPTWTPDGENIVFAKTGGSDKESIAIYRLDLKTRKIALVPNSHGLFSPRLSPDGRYISALTSAATKLMLLDTKTNQWSKLREGETLSCNEWSHDGKYVYFRESGNGAGEVVRVRAKDGLPERVLSLQGFPQLADIFTGWIGLTPDDEPLMMRDRSVQEIYALDLNLP